MTFSLELFTPLDGITGLSMPEHVAPNESEVQVVQVVALRKFPVHKL